VSESFLERRATTTNPCGAGVFPRRGASRGRTRDTGSVQTLYGSASGACPVAVRAWVFFPVNREGGPLGRSCPAARGAA
jgi:hypothetical protein